MQKGQDVRGRGSGGKASAEQKGVVGTRRGRFAQGRGTRDRYRVEVLRLLLSSRFSLSPFVPSCFPVSFFSRRSTGTESDGEEEILLSID